MVKLVLQYSNNKRLRNNLHTWNSVWNITTLSEATADNWPDNGELNVPLDLTTALTHLTADMSMTMTPWTPASQKCTKVTPTCQWPLQCCDTSKVRRNETAHLQQSSYDSGPNSTSLDMTRHVLSCWNVTCRTCSNMADEEVMVIPCTSLVFCVPDRNIKSENMQCGTRLFDKVCDSLWHIRCVI